MSKKPYMPLVLGTARNGRRSEKVALYFFELLKKHNVSSRLVDVRKMITPYTVAAWMEDEKAADWRKIATKADALIIVTPEYNHGYPGELKILLDYAFKEYEDKPVGLCTVSNGGFGGVRCAENLLPVLHAFKMCVVYEKIHISNVEKSFSKDKNELDAEYKEKFDNLVKSLDEHIKI
ncbi:MAG: NADPH-dependent FMN reductase [Candidatus Magasanikbacteria bacterium]|nr:NADPH-dependent FMN reductase [Candidatus Magasanikbacteria bacterium]